VLRNFYRCAALLLLLAPAAAAQTRPAAGVGSTLGAEAAAQLRAQAEECGRAFVENDFERLAFYTHPKVVRMMGGREQMVSFVRKGVGEMKAEGFETLSYVPSEPTQVLRVGRQTYAVVPATLRMRSPGGVLVSESFMIAVSSDGGKNWKFVSGGSADPARLKMLFPAAAGRLRMPPRKAPTLEPAP
jgi:hypothetical protein